MTQQEHIMSSPLENAEREVVLPEICAGYGVAVDLDYSLINSTLAFDSLKTVCREFQIETDAMDQASAAATANKESFSPVAFLNQTQAPDIVDQIKSRFLDITKAEDILYEDTNTFIQDIFANDIPFFLLTMVTLNGKCLNWKLPVCWTIRSLSRR